MIRVATSSSTPEHGEEEEGAAPVGDAGELPSQDGADDRGETAEDGQSPEVADQRTAFIDVPAGRLRDDDPHRACQPLHEPGDHQGHEVRADRAQHGRGDVRGDACEQRWAASEPVRQRPGDDLPGSEPDQTGGQGELCLGGGRAEIARQRGQDRQVEVHRDGAEHGEQHQQRGQGRPDVSRGRCGRPGTSRPCRLVVHATASSVSGRVPPRPAARTCRSRRSARRCIVSSLVMAVVVAGAVAADVVLGGAVPGQRPPVAALPGVRFGSFASGTRPDLVERAERLGREGQVRGSQRFGQLLGGARPDDGGGDG
ncbi:hypothetical protein SVIOM74S_04131 [Streptomyces violarus]